jgi:hypothetical protein
MYMYFLTLPIILLWEYYSLKATTKLLNIALYQYKAVFCDMTPWSLVDRYLYIKNKSVALISTPNFRIFRYFLSNSRNVQCSAPQKLCYKHNISLVTSLYLILICFGKCLRIVECSLWHGIPGFNFTYTSSTICHVATQVFKIFHILGVDFDLSKLVLGMVT